ncbi:MAG: hypothetical protein NW220_14415 [Leptolyngbyaceae cyanobacterium bins.349]|nr:hypothetical protein [Leptolyngbyaceae cyanobacterium bins.349]
MSPSPDLSPNQPSSSEPMPSELLTSAADSPSDAPESGIDEAEHSTQAEKENAPILRKPPMRPVRPQPPQASAKSVASVGAAAKPESVMKPANPKPEIVSVSSAAAVTPPSAITSAPSVQPEPLSAEEQAVQAALRQQPIPPPSEPKQYRAIGLVRGMYQPSEEEFTRGDFKAADGSDLKAVLLGRVMSLVKNHIDLEKEHLWVVYPRTREEEKELHLQIVGVWEPETLKKSELEGEEADSDATAMADGSFTDPRLEDDYFSVRGEIVFISPDDKLIVVKIQQTPRKSSQKAKAFKLALRGELDSTRTVGYFWDLHIKREDNSLLVTDGTCIGMAPPKKRDKDFVGKGRPPRKPAFGRGGKGPVGRSPRSDAPRPHREPASKPIKRTEQNPTSES